MESLLNKVAGLTPIFKNICQGLLLHCTHIIHCYLSVILYIQHLLPHHHCYYSEAVVWRCPIKKVFIESSQNSLENTCARVSFFLLKLQGFRRAALLKKRPWHRCFSVNFAKFLRTPFAIDYLWWLLWLLLISPMFVSGSISKGFKEFKSGISFSLKSLPSVSFSFFHVFSVFLSFVCFSYSCCS